MNILILEEDGAHAVVGEAANGQQALEMSEALSPDVVLLDIRMPGMSGIETAQHLNASDRPPAVIFATAYDEYAIDAFEANAIGYVLKPVRRERLNQALELADERRNHLCTRSLGELKLIPIADIRYIIADQKYVNVFHRNGQDLIDDSLKALEEEFPDVFVRIHRGALVAVSSIDALKKTADGQTRVALRDVEPHDAGRLIVSRRHLTNVKRRLKKG